MTHFDYILKLAEGFVITASTKDFLIAAFENYEKNFYGIQYHPVVIY